MKSIQINLSSRKFTILLISILILIYILLVIGIILGRSYYSEIRHNFIYPIVILKEYYESKKNFFTILNKEIDFIFNDETLEKVDIKISQNTKDDLEKDLNTIKQSGNILGDRYKKYYNLKILKNKSIEIKGKFRLKGNLPGHRSIDYFPSINVKLQRDKTYLGMTDFSIHSPIPKRNLWEPLSFLFYRDQDILSPNSEYIDLSVNETKYGVHLINERISKKFLENQKRRLGPIIEMENKLPQNDFDLDGFKLFNNKSISLRSMFQNNNPELINIRSVALKKLKLYIDKSISPEEVFDFDILAKMVAIKDLLLDPELVFNEIKWYYNPLTSLFEPIDFDPHSGTSNLNGPLIINVESKLKHHTDQFFRPILENLDFISHYQKHIKRYSSTKFLSNFFEKHEQYFINQENALQEKFARRHIEYIIPMKDLITKRAQLVRKVLNYNKTLNAHYNLKDGILEFHFENISNSNYYNLNGIKLLDYNIKLKDKIVVPPLSNRKFSISVIDFISNTKISKKIDENKLIQNFYYHLLVKSPKKQRSFISFENKGSSNDINFKIIAERRPIVELRNIQNISPKNLKSLPKFLKNGSTVSGNKIIVNGKINFKESYSFNDVLFELRPGSSLVFTNEAIVQFNNGFKSIGRKDKRITIESLDGTGAIVLRDQKSKTLIKNTDIRNFDLKKTYLSDLLLTSPITFYNANLEIVDTKITNIVAEDAMNIVASRGKINNLSITNNPLSDCLDIDFSEIEIEKISVSECGNDGLDFSYSNILAKNIQVNKTNDKGISIGEKSVVKFDKTQISDSKIAIASKDGSSSILNDVHLKNVNYGFVVYNKKSGFKTPSIYLYKVKNEGKIKSLFSKYKIGKIFIKGNLAEKIGDFPKVEID